MSEKKHDPPNLDLIANVQRARMQHDAEATPSHIDGVYWIEAKALATDTPAPTTRSGQFVIETTTAEVDKLWEKVKTATETGKLGYKSKVATASRAQGQPESRLICVRTYDADDHNDRVRIREALSQLGILSELRYETGS